MVELLFEIFSEEIPARMQLRAGGNLVRLMDTALTDAGLTPKESKIMTGPRRMTYITEVESRSPDVSDERKGPRVGAPERALEGFMRGAGIADISEAEIRSDKKGDFYVAVIQSKGRDTADILREVIPTVMGDFPWPKSMTSGDSDFRWVRPLRGLTVLLDGTAIDGITVSGIASDNQVHGHRQMGPGPFSVSSFEDYRNTLEGEGHVMLDRDARKARILEQAQAVCADAGLELVEDAGLLDEVAGLVEWPVALLGDMDPDFLELPDEVIRLTLKSHQKTFTVRDPEDGKLAPHFVIIANLGTPDQGATIKAGNAKVISARLSDARFFQEEDRKKTLQDYYDQLDEVVFHKKLGSVRDKAERVAALAREIAPHVGADPDVAERAANLSKCDLVTQTVIEATSLQGKVGRWMYEAEQTLTSSSLQGSSLQSRAEGSDLSGADALDHKNTSCDDDDLCKADHAAIAVAIEDHYKPQGPSDAVPTNPVAIAVALADKIDTLVGFWAIDEKPTGSKDPYALRRAALGVIQTIKVNSIKLNIGNWFRRSYEILRDQLLRVDELGDVIEVKSEDEDGNRIRPLILMSYRVTVEVGYSADIDFWKNEISEFGCLIVASATEKEVDTEEEGRKISRGAFSSLAEITELLHDFLLDRLRVYLRDQGHRHDVIDAVIAQGGNDLLAISQRVEALGAFLSDGGGEDLVQGYKRAANILKAVEKKSGSSAVIPAKRSAEPGPDGGKDASDVTQASGPGSAASGLVRDDNYSAEEAKALSKALITTRPAIDSALASADYPAALSALADLREPIDAFFENVVVNSDDAAERARRLALLSAIVETFHRIADFSRLDG